MTEHTSTNLKCTASACIAKLHLSSEIKSTWSPAVGHVHRALELAGNYLGWRKDRTTGQILCPVHVEGREVREL